VKPSRHLLIVAVAMAIMAFVPANEAIAQSDHEGRAIAESVMEAMGGQDAWDSTRHLSWDFMGRGRHHHWDKWTGDVRISVPAGEDRQGNPRPATVTLMNINTREGRAWADGEEVVGEPLAEMLEQGWRAWVNDAYWMFMPYKMLDPGVNLTYVGEDIMADDREVDVLQLTFESVGVTPDNRYLIYVAHDSGLVEQWSWFPNRDDPEPGFTRPWAGWERFGDILIATDHGAGADWKIAVFDELPAAVYTDPDYERE
jgi:hypothetical protein